MKCKTCGHNLAYSPSRNMLFCSHCKNTQTVEKLAPIHKSALKFAAQKITEAAILCTGCGAQTLIDSNTAATSCAYCGSHIRREVMEAIQKPHNITPFRVEKTEAQIRTLTWLKGLWFAPNSLKKLVKKMDNIKGTYIPFWCFDANSYNHYVGERGVYYYQTKTRTTSDGKTETYQERYTDWSPASGEFAQNFTNHLTAAQNSLSKNLRLEPWNFNEFEAFNPDYLPGFEALISNISLEDGWNTSTISFKSQIESTARRDIGGDEQRITSIETNFSAERYNQVVLPVWTGSYTFRGKVFHVFVNGQTGQVEAERPYSWIKIISAVTSTSITLGLAFIAIDDPHRFYDMLRLLGI